ncbi:MAG: PBP1A family penicillin-binding protein [Lachnospiraceae bacterium]|nr:PBP1A family penicillin-binding protein [Lachnospiraceae bacterium]
MDYSKDAEAKRNHPSRKKRQRIKNRFAVIFLRIFFVAVIIGVFAMGGAVLGAYMGIVENAPALNTIDVVPENYTSVIYDQQEIEIDLLHGDENREYASLEDIPLNLKNAIIAIEDERFYDHNGIDFKGMLRALVVNIKAMDMSQGASTITQQLIKNEILTSEKKIERKLQEQYLAVKLEKELTKKLGSKKKAKDYILELYLNSIGLNHGLNGVKSAAKFYFGKELEALTLAECASIAGITKNPSAYSPLSYPENNKERQLTVLSKMLELGYITQAEYDQAKDEDIYSKIVGKLVDDSSTSKVHSYFVDALINELAADIVEQKGMTEKQAFNLIYSGGLQVYSTIDTDMQEIMDASYADDSLFPPAGDTYDVTYTISLLNKETNEQEHFSKKTTVSAENADAETEAFIASVKEELITDKYSFVLDNVSTSRSLQSAMVILDYHTGEVKALIGGRGEKTGNLVFNRATQALRQPGSCFKVLASYAPAIDLGIVMPPTIIQDEPFTAEQWNWTPSNWYGSDTYRGPCTVREGIRDSLNILAAKTIINVGVERAFEYLENFGFTSLVRSRETPNGIVSDVVPATSLGGITDGVSILELTAAYGTIANGGIYLKPSLYSKVLDHDGNIFLENNPEPKRVIKETTAFLLTDMMEDVISGGGTGGLARFKNVSMNLAGKTGTTSDDKDLCFAGYSPYYVAGIWLGYDQPQKIKYDKSYHLLLWRDVMEKIHEGLENKKFEKPDGISSITLCRASGQLAVPGLCENDYYGYTTVTDYCTSDFSVPETCQCHKKFRICMDSGQLAGEYCPESSVQELVLAVDPETGELLYKNVPDGKIAIDISKTCEYHTAENYVPPFGSSAYPGTGIYDYPYTDPLDEIIPDSNNNNPAENEDSSGDSSNLPPLGSLE